MTSRPGSLGCLDTLPRVDLSHVPTPLEEMKHMTAAVGGARMFVKRDDCTGLAMGGNKARQLEFYLGAARAHAADTVLITGAVQSNFVRMTAAAARKLGMDVHVQLEDRVPLRDQGYARSGNVLLDYLLGATVHQYPRGEDEAGADQHLEEIADDLRRRGKTPYVIHLGLGHPPLGALGYVRAARELLQQTEERQLHIDEVVVGSGSGHTHAGLLFGLRALSCPVRVTGVCVRRNKEAQNDRILDHSQRIAALLGIENPVTAADVVLTDDFLAPGYGQFNAAMLDAMALSAQREALLLDPVYTAKAMAGAICRAQELGRGKTVVFVHTGGTPALFGYESFLTPIFQNGYQLLAEPRIP